MKKLSPVLIWSLIASVFILIVVIVLAVSGLSKSVDTTKGLFGKAWKDAEGAGNAADAGGAAENDGIFGDIYRDFAKEGASESQESAGSSESEPDFPSEVLETQSKSGKLLIIRKPSALSDAVVTMSDSPVDRRLDIKFSRAGAIRGVSDFPVARVAASEVYETQNLTPVTFVSMLDDKLPNYFEAAAAADEAESVQADETAAADEAESAQAGEAAAADDTPAQADGRFAFDMPDDADFLAAMSVKSDYERNETTLSLQFYDTYEFDMWDDGEFVFVECYRPRELYDRIVIVDAGHGGEDPGAISGGEGSHEKDINLGIVMCLKRYLSRLKGVKVYYTRLDDSTVTHSQRLELANNLQADLMLSIHCNSSDSASMSGTEVLYASCVPASERFATQLCIAAAGATGFRNRGIVSRDNIMLLRDTLVPSVIVECGFLSNEKERTFLSAPENQDAVAAELFKTLEELL